jgi:diguanylate cyclase (GGDEF)-like protein/PAS domain S-box-containing protein
MGLVALPLVLVAAMASVQAVVLHRQTAEADRLVARVERGVALSGVIEAAGAESGASLGLVAASELGWSPSQAQARLGFDVRGELAGARAHLDRRLGALDRAAGVDEAVEGVVDDLARVRADIDAGRAGVAEVRAYYDRLAMALRDHLAHDLDSAVIAAARLDGGGDLAATLLDVRDLYHLAGAPARWKSVGTEQVLVADRDQAVTFAGALHRHEELVAEMTRRHPELADDQRWAKAAAGTAERLATARAVLAVAFAPEPDLGQQVAAARTMRRLAAAEARRMDLVGELAGDVTRQVEQGALELGRQARDRLVATLAVAVAALAAVGALAARTTASIGRPLEALRVRAAAVTAGRLEAGSGGGGPLEVLEADRALDGLIEALQLLGRQAEALAAGQLADPVLSQRVPGPLGDAVAGTVDRLRAVTGELRRSEQRARAVIEAAAEAIVLVGDDGRVRSANSAARRLFGAELEGARLADHLPGADPHGTPGGERAILRPGGERVPVLVSTSTLDLGGERVSVVVCRDISDRKALEDRLTHQALHDPLTGLWNRAGLLRHLAERAAGGEPVGLVYVDLDRFKLINDGHGHLVGDEVLVEAANRLVGSVRPGDPVTRLGGDEFVVAVSLPAAANPQEPAQLVALAERLMAELAAPVHTTIGPIRVTSSAGVAVDREGLEPLELLRRADLALYQAKTEHRGQCRIYDPEVAAADLRSRRVERDLRRAVERDEMRLWYQPIVELGTGRTVGLEALVRWEHPDDGLLGPEEFVPVAERSGLILDLDRWVLRRATADLAGLAGDERTAGWTVAVNVSARHLAEGHLTATIEAALAATGVDPERLELEVTESHVLGDWWHVLPGLRELEALGVTLALDDFGTGYSNLTHLLHLPITTIKVDRGFVASLDDRVGRGIVAALSRFARIGGLRVVAEGVEQPHQREALLALGCDLGQGHLFASPAPLADLVPAHGAGGRAGVAAPSGGSAAGRGPSGPGLSAGS